MTTQPLTLHPADRLNWLLADPSTRQALKFIGITLAIVLAALPIFIGLILFQRHLIRGLTTGAVKG